MRIIKGKYGKRRFSVPTSFSARPTTDFAKENLFNVLENSVDWEEMKALDLFSGTGSIAFEMLSRGCISVTSVEQNFQHASFIQKVSNELEAENFELIRGDVFRYIKSLKPESFDLIFADPPYALKELSEIPTLIFEKNVLKDGGMLIMEHPSTVDFSNKPYFKQLRTYGSVNFSVFIKEEAKTDA